MTLGTLDPRLELMMMEEVSSLFLKPSDFSRRTISGQREPSDSSLGVERSKVVIFKELFSILLFTRTKSANTSQPSKVMKAALNFMELVIQEVERTSFKMFSRTIYQFSMQEPMTQMAQ